MDLITPKDYTEERISLAAEADAIARASLAEGNSERDAEEARSEWLWQTIDGHQWILYTWQAQQVLVHSDHSDAYVDDFGTDGVVSDGAINWSALAMMALLADVRETLTAVDELRETCSKCGESWPCSDSTRTDIRGDVRAAHTVQS